MMMELQLATRAVAALEKLADAQTKLAIEAKRSNDELFSPKTNKQGS